MSTTSAHFYLRSVEGQQLASTKALQPVAQYVRMSTEMQCFSTQNQMEAIARYAESHNMTVVRTFSDEGRSGLNLNQRPGLRSLLSMVQKGTADFQAVLVYDVSRWGRFQDVDESGYWEYVCKRAGVQIHYCAEPFTNDSCLPSVIFKGLKRTMAAEYSRELSVKVFAGQCRLFDLGYHLGGPSGFGMRRLLVDSENRPKTLLEPGQLKSIQSDRVILVPGPEQEQQVIREIFHAFVNKGMSQAQIARDLNRQGVSGEANRHWRVQSVHDVLINPRYIGTNVFNRRSQKLRTQMVQNPPELWIRKENALPSIVSPELFRKAAELLEERCRVPTEDELLNQLRLVWEREGRLTGALIDKAQCIRGSGYLFSHFGGLQQVYKKLGYAPVRVASFLRCDRKIQFLAVEFVNEVLSQLKACGASVEVLRNTRTLRVNGNLRLQLSLIKSFRMQGGLRWCLADKSAACDLAITARLNEDNSRILDYFVFPAAEHPGRRYISSDNISPLEVYRFQALDSVWQACRRTRLGD